MRRVAITGGIADGKSTVLQMVAETGRRVLDVDNIVAGLWSNKSFTGELASALGIPQVSQQIVRELIARDPAKRRVLNAHFHGAVTRQMLESDAEFIEVPLLIEGCLQGHFDAIWVVAAGKEEQVGRLQSRAGHLALLEAQLPTLAKSVFADELIRTNQPLVTVHAQVLSALQRRGT